MKGRLDSHPFWGPHSPLSALTGTGLVIIASGRVSFAIICGVTLLWVYGLTALVFLGAMSIMPARGRMVILLFLSSFLCGIFMFLIGLINPLLMLGMEFFLVLIPPCCLGSGLFDGTEPAHQEEFVTRALLEAAVLSGIILGLALIREPLGLGTISFPGGTQGVIEVIGSGEGSGFIPVRILSASAGGLLLFGYGVSLYRYYRERNGGGKNQ
jgi:hypothetical protein